MRSVVTVPAVASLITYTHENGDKRPEDPREAGRRRTGRIAAASIITPSAMDHAVDSLNRCPPDGRVGDTEMSAGRLGARQGELDDSHTGQRPSLPRQGRQAADRHPRATGRWDRRNGGDLRTPRQSTQYLGLLDGRGVPLPARLAGAQVLVDAGGGDGFALPVDPGRQRFPGDVAVHGVIVAHHR